MREQRKSFLDVESILGLDAGSSVDMVTKNLEYYLKLVDKATAGFARIDSDYKRSLTVDKILSDNIAGCWEIVGERISQSIRQTSLSYFKKYPQISQPLTLSR